MYLSHWKYKDRVVRSKSVRVDQAKMFNIIRKLSNFYLYEGYPENKFRLRILPLQRCGHDGAQACRVFGFFVKARTQFADI